MLTSLAIRDVVLIERLDLSLGAGLTVLTGETGAGKSILLDSLGLALGQRAEAGMVRSGQAQASVAACFHLPPEHPARLLLTEQGIGAEDELVPEASVRKLVDKLNTQRGIKIDYRVQEGAGHVFTAEQTERVAAAAEDHVHTMLNRARMAMAAD